MRTLIIIPVLLFSLFWGASSYSADFNKGLTAAQSGDFATALKEWKPLAGQGDADAQTNLCCLLYTSPSPRDKRLSRMPSSA